MTPAPGLGSRSLAGLSSVPSASGAMRASQVPGPPHPEEASHPLQRASPSQVLDWGRRLASGGLSGPPCRLADEPVLSGVLAVALGRDQPFPLPGPRPAPQSRGHWLLPWPLGGQVACGPASGMGCSQGGSDRKQQSRLTRAEPGGRERPDSELWPLRP